jgi:hypothetical protein
MKHSTKRLRAKLSRDGVCVVPRDQLHRPLLQVMLFRHEPIRAGEHMEFVVAKYSNKWTIR